MSRIITRGTLFRMCMLLFAASQLPLSAKKRDENFKNWNEGPLTWADYRAVESPTDPGIPSVSVFKYSTTRKKVKIENYKIVYNQVDCVLDRDNSWYVPDMADELSLRSNQVVFDIWELCSRQVQTKCFGETTLTFNKTMDRHAELALNRIDEFEKESVTENGIDSVVLRKYEEALKSDLKYTKRREPDLSLAGRVPDMLGMYFSYVHESFIGNTSDYLKPMNGISLGFDYINKKDWYFDLGMSFAFSSLKAGGFYHDKQYNYDWTAGKSTNHMRMYLNIGHAAKLDQYYRIIPFAGIAYASLIQSTDTQIPNKKNESFYSSELNGVSFMAGVNADWIFRHSIFPDERLDSSLRFKLFGAYDKLGDKSMWSVNFGVAFHLNVKTYNAPMFLYIPIII